MRILLAYIIFGAVLNANCQQIQLIELNIGGSFAKQDWQYYQPNIATNYEPVTGGLYGLGLHFSVNKYFSVSPYIGFIQKGFKVILPTGNTPGSYGTESVAVRFNYGTAELRCNFGISLKSFRPFVFVGPRIDYLFNVKSTNDRYNLQPLVKDMNNPLYGLTGGLGFVLKGKRFGVSLTGAYLYDFDNFLNLEPSQSRAGIKAKNSAYTMSLGILYFIRRA